MFWYKFIHLYFSKNRVHYNFGLLNHKLRLKVGVPLMLLRNINQPLGFYNGIKLIITKMEKHVGKKVYIPNLSLTPFNKILMTSRAITQTCWSISTTINLLPWITIYYHVKGYNYIFSCQRLL